MKRHFLKTLAAAAAVAASFALPSVAMAADITGAGATFPYPIYAKWPRPTRHRLVSA